MVPGRGHPLLWVCACATWLLAAPAVGEQVQRRDADGRMLGAVFDGGRRDRPAVLFVHDFLHTATTPLARSLGERLASEGISVLRPNLSLGIGWRAEALPCAAVHRHRFERDLAELGGWLDWLIGRGHQRILLVGHGFGAWQALALARHYRTDTLRAVVALAPSALPNDLPAQFEALRAASGEGSETLYRLALLDCPEFASDAGDWLSYARWSAAAADALLAEMHLPVRALVAGRDRRFDGVWRERLRRAGVQLQLHPDALDFADAEDAGALLDYIVAAVVVEGG